MPNAPIKKLAAEMSEEQRTEAISVARAANIISKDMDEDLFAPPCIDANQGPYLLTPVLASIFCFLSCSFTWSFSLLCTVCIEPDNHFDCPT